MSGIGSISSAISQQNAAKAQAQQVEHYKKKAWENYVTNAERVVVKTCIPECNNGVDK